MSWDPIRARVLSGRYVRLEPLALEHAPALEAHYSPELVRYFPDHWSSAREFVERVLEFNRRGEWVSFAQVDTGSGLAVGSTSFLAISARNRRLEIGGTWIGRACQGTPLNAEAKLLLLGFAFNELGCGRVELKTDSLNLQSRAAMTKLGLVEEGTFRNHMLMSDGRWRHSVYFSAIAEEWPELERKIRSRIESKESRPG